MSRVPGKPERVVTNASAANRADAQRRPQQGSCRTCVPHTRGHQ
jgi:hypothetical protein